MKPTEIRVILSDKRHSSQLQAFCTVIIEHALAIHDIRIVEGPRGLFVAFPDRKILSRCVACTRKNPLMANFCQFCGNKLNPQIENMPKDDVTGKARIHADIVHPVDHEFRKLLVREILQEFYREKDKARGIAAEVGLE